MTQLAVLLALLFVVVYGIAHDYLWGTLWYSSIAHFLGGLWAGALAVSLLRYRGLHPNIVFCAAFALIVGAGWELYEFLMGVTYFPEYTVDTIADLVMDVLGGGVAGYMVRRRTSG